MLIKFLVNRGGGSIHATANYLLGKNRDRELASVLNGDIDETIRLAESLKFKHKYSAGVLSFAESDLSDKTKQEIMTEFERCIFSGLDRDQYNITWIEHKDKDRLELNFVIPKVELSSGKSYNPYYDRTDRPLVNAFKNYINAKYELDDPNDPSRKQMLVLDKRLPKNKKELQQAISEYIAIKIENNLIKNRDDIITTLQDDLQLTITRITDKSISIQDPEGGRNIRLKGEIYEQSFRFDSENQKTKSELAAEYRESIKERQARATVDYQTELQRRTQYNRSKYARVSEKVTTADRARTASDHDKDNTADFFISVGAADTTAVRELSSVNSRANDADRGDAQDDTEHKPEHQQAIRINTTEHQATSRDDTAECTEINTKESQRTDTSIQPIYTNYHRDNTQDDARTSSTAITSNQRQNTTSVRAVRELYQHNIRAAENSRADNKQAQAVAAQTARASTIDELINRIDKNAKNDTSRIESFVHDEQNDGLSVVHVVNSAHIDSYRSSDRANAFNAINSSNDSNTSTFSSSSNLLHQQENRLNNKSEQKNENILQRFIETINAFRARTARVITNHIDAIAKRARELDDSTRETADRLVEAITRISKYNSNNTNRVERATRATNINKQRATGSERQIAQAQSTIRAADEQANDSEQRIDSSKSTLRTISEQINRLARESEQRKSAATAADERINDSKQRISRSESAITASTTDNESTFDYIKEKQSRFIGYIQHRDEYIQKTSDRTAKLITAASNRITEKQQARERERINSSKYSSPSPFD